MTAGLAEGIKSAGALVTLVEKIFDRVVNISDRKKRKEEISRLYDLLEQIRVSRARNMELADYVQSVMRDDAWKREKNKLVSQLEKSLSALVKIVDTMADAQDRIVLFKNKEFVQLTLIARDRANLLKELKELDEKNSGRQLVTVIRKYQTLSQKMERIGEKLSTHGRNLDKSLR